MTPKIRSIELLDIHLLDTNDVLSFVGVVDLKINGQAASYINDVSISETDARIGFVPHTIVDQDLKVQFGLDDEEYSGLVTAIHGLADPLLVDIWHDGPYCDLSPV